MSYLIIVSPFFILCITSGIVIIVVGWILTKYPPKNINYWYGYRTPSSLRSQERWDFAQKYAAREMIRLGLLLLIISFLGFLLPGSLTEAFAGVIIFLVLVITLLFRVERAIGKKFKN